MKTIIKAIAILLITLSGFSAQAQTTKADKKASNIARIKNLINSRNYIVTANYALPLRGGGRVINGSYDVLITKDTIRAFLPYFGRAYVADYGSTDGGIKFTATKFTYEVTNNNSSWDILIKFTDAKMNDPKGVRQMRLSISASGYATIQILNANRDPITFNGNIEERPKTTGM